MCFVSRLYDIIIHQHKMSFPPAFPDDDGIILIDESDDESNKTTSSSSDLNLSKKSVGHPNDEGVAACAGDDDDDASSSWSPRLNYQNPVSLAPDTQNGNQAADESDSFIIELDISEIRALNERSDDEGDSNSSSSSSGIPSPWKRNSRSNNNIGGKINDNSGIERNFGIGSPSSIGKDSESDESIFEYRIAGKTNFSADEFSQSTKRRRCFRSDHNDDSVDRSFPTMNDINFCNHQTTMSNTKSNGGKKTLQKSKKKPPNKSAASVVDEDTTMKPAKNVEKSKFKRRPWGKSTWRNRKKPPSKTSNEEIAMPSDQQSISQKTALSITTTNNSDKPNQITGTKHFHCYLLRSLHPDHPLKSYIGFSTYPPRRLRQHNGILKNGGAHRTKRSGRPWTFVTIIHGFTDKITALQFEWAWQNVHKSKSFREAVGCDKLAKKMRKRLGVKARLEELRILLRECLPFCLYSLVVYFPEEKYRDVFCRLVLEASNRKRNEKVEQNRVDILDEGDGDDDSPHSASDEEFLANCVKLCPIDEMPFARDELEIKEKKKAARKNQRLAKIKAKKIGKFGSCGANERESDNSLCHSEIGDRKASIDESPLRILTGDATESNQESTNDDNSIGSSSTSNSNRHHIEQQMEISLNKIDESGHSSINVFGGNDGKYGNDAFVGNAKDTAVNEGNYWEETREDDVVEVIDFHSLSLDRHHASDDEIIDRCAENCDSSIASSASSGSSCYLGGATEKENQLQSNNRLRQDNTNFAKQNVYDLCDSP